MKTETHREKSISALNHFQQPFSNNVVPQNQPLSNIPPTQENTLTQQQQLVQLPIIPQPAATVPEMKPPVNTATNNMSSAVNKNILSHPVAAQAPPPIVASKAELPQISPTGNNNKSNINNLNHLNSQQQHISMSSSNAQSLLNMTIPNTQGQVVNMMSSVSQASALLSANSTNLNQMKHQAQFGMNPFIDPLEHSLASLEQPLMNSQKADVNSMLMELQNQKMMMNTHIPSGPNGFGDFSGVNGVNSLMNILGMPQMDPQNNIFMNAQIKQNRQFPEAPWPSNNSMIKPNTSQPNVPMNHSSQQQSMQMQPPPQSQPPLPPQQQPPPLPQPSPKSANKEKIMLTPKPIEELLMNPNEKSKSIAASSSFGPPFNKAEQNLKNASSWSQLGHGSPQSMMGVASAPATKTKMPSDTFQEFKTKAKEQAQRQKQEQEKMKKQKEQEFKRQQESLIQKQKTTEDLSNGHK